MSQWLDPDHTEFMGIADLVVVCSCIGVSIEDVLPPSRWLQRSRMGKGADRVAGITLLPQLFDFVMPVLLDWWNGVTLLIKLQ